MTKSDFIMLLKKYAVSGAVDNVASYLEKPSGRNPDGEILQISDWFMSLSDVDRKNVFQFARDVADECFFGVCAIVDGVRVVDNDTDCFEISRVTYEGQKKPLSGVVDFHDLC